MYFLDEVTQASGIAPIIARGAICRAVVRAGLPCDRETFGRGSLVTAMPEILKTMELYLGPDEWTVHRERLRALALPSKAELR